MAVKDGMLQRAVKFLRGAGPYLAVELLLPGGTLIALLLWWFSGGSARGQLTRVEKLPHPISIERVVCVCGSAA